MLKYNLIAKDHNGRPAINGHGAGVIIDPIKFIHDPSFALGSESYGYVDVSSILDVYHNGFDLGYDYLFVRDRIIELVELKATDSGATEDLQEVGYGLCTLDEKEVLARLFIGDLATHEQDFGKQRVAVWHKERHSESTKAREYRMLQAETLINRELGELEKTAIMAFLTSLVVQVDLIGTGTPQTYCFDHHKNYLKFGRTAGILNYFNGLEMFAGRGLVNMPWQPKTLTMVELASQLTFILRDGVEG